MTKTKMKTVILNQLLELRQIGLRANEPVEEQAERDVERAERMTRFMGWVLPTATGISVVEFLYPLLQGMDSVAVMELGALICVAGTPRCGVCPVRDRCAWRLAGSPAHDGPPRRVQKFAGTDRQVRGRLLDVLRAASHPVTGADLDAAWDDAVQRGRCLDSLLVDGLVVQTEDGLFTLPG